MLHAEKLSNSFTIKNVALKVQTEIATWRYHWSKIEGLNSSNYIEQVTFMVTEIFSRIHFQQEVELIKFEKLSYYVNRLTAVDIALPKYKSTIFSDRVFEDQVNNSGRWIQNIAHRKWVKVSAKIGCIVLNWREVATDYWRKALTY